MSRKSKPPIALYSALADTTRCRILEILKVAPTPVHVLTEAFSISRPAISRHLRVLKSAGLVAEVKKGRENVYAFRPARLDAARTWLEAIRSADASAEEVVEEAPVAVVASLPAPADAVLPAAPAAPKRPRTPKQKPTVSADKPVQDSAPIPQTPSTSQMGFDF
ncbi:hypothetical protein ASD83_05510 [Devosia sp. Root685]|uniref:ArsR/SmtB family transcription factor n=1 Tax=Devosia sp. Root685 TaxID=1736587 RepID=UPI0006FCE970|nr:metalloregulator ArsR/SmtB family transcription factor [Devosia sp. Root685]KRA99940.1 hypothetical protein ASD83_05510 [Devosia sp. Root685]